MSEEPTPTRRRNRIIVGGIIGAMVIIAGLGLVFRDDSEPEPTGGRTAVEVACDMLNDGDSERLTYDVLVHLLRDSTVGDDHERAAELAVTQAKAQGCG